MRFVSKSPRLGLGTVITEKFVLALDGQRDRTRESVSVQFSQEDLGIEDVRFAKSYWPEKEFTGRWLDADGVTLQPIDERIGSFDTDKQGYDDEMRRHVEKWMLGKQNYGSDFVVVEKVALRAPWGSYDKMHHAKIAPFATEAGLVEEALAYEREAKKRPGVIEALEAELATEAPEGDLIVA